MTADDPVLACLQGRITPALAIARLVLAGEDAAAIRRRLEARQEAGDPRIVQRWHALHDLAMQEGALCRLRAVLAASGVDHGGAATPAEIAAAFDRAVAVWPEASVALYSLGDGARLQAATLEIRGWLAAAGLLDAAARVLDLGCGIGRIVAAIAPCVRWVVGTDVSAGMLHEARRRCATVGNAAFVQVAGQDLGAFAAASFDLVLAVDSFPYLVQAGVARAHVAEAARVLRGGGRLVVLNFSYRNDPALDLADAQSWAGEGGFALRQAGVGNFRTWDAPAYIFERRG